MSASVTNGNGNPIQVQITLEDLVEQTIVSFQSRCPIHNTLRELRAALKELQDNQVKLTIKVSGVAAAVAILVSLVSSLIFKG